MCNFFQALCMTTFGRLCLQCESLARLMRYYIRYHTSRTYGHIAPMFIWKKLSLQSCQLRFRICWSSGKLLAAILELVISDSHLEKPVYALRRVHTIGHARRAKTFQYTSKEGEWQARKWRQERGNDGKTWTDSCLWVSLNEIPETVSIIT